MNKVLHTKNVAISINYEEFSSISFGCGKYETYIELYAENNGFICGINWKYKGEYLFSTEIFTPFKNVTEFKEQLTKSVDDNIFINHIDALKETTIVMEETLKNYK